MKIGIAGSGLLGRLFAYELAKREHQVTLFDRDHKNGEQSAGFAAAGMLAPYGELEIAATDIFEKGIEALTLWPKLIEELQADIYYKQNGSLLVAHSQDQAVLPSLVTKIEKKLPSDYERIQRLTTEQVHQLEPELNIHGSGVYFPSEAHFDNQAFYHAIADKIIEKGVLWYSGCEVTAVNPFEIVTNTKQQFDLVLDCRGTGAKSQIPQLRSVRGELLWLQAPEVNISRPVRLYHPRYRIYLTPRPNHIYIVGATEIESDDRSPISVRTCLEQLSAAYSLHRGFAEARLIKTVANCRPAMPDNHPVILKEEGIIRVNGLYRHGYLLSLGLVNKIITELEG